MKNKRNVLLGLAMMLAGIIYVSVQAQQKDGSSRAGFSGEWRSKESISMGGNIVCTYFEGDRTLSKTMKIVEQAGALSIEVPKPSGGTILAPNVEKLTFDGKKSKVTYGKDRGKEFAVKLSADGKTMTVSSVVHLMVPTPYKVKVLKPLIVNVTEVWKLSDDGRSITVQSNARSNDFGDTRNWKTVFYRTT